MFFIETIQLFNKQKNAKSIISEMDRYMYGPKRQPVVQRELLSSITCHSVAMTWLCHYK
jgi:hypothetical protein